MRQPPKKRTKLEHDAVSCRTRSKAPLLSTTIKLADSTTTTTNAASTITACTITIDATSSRTKGKMTLNKSKELIKTTSTRKNLSVRTRSKEGFHNNLVLLL